MCVNMGAVWIHAQRSTVRPETRPLRREGFGMRTRGRVRGAQHLVGPVRTVLLPIPISHALLTTLRASSLDLVVVQVNGPSV